MATTGVVKKPFPYAIDGVNLAHLKEGQVLSFPDRFFEGLKSAGYVDASDGEPENSVGEAVERDRALDDTSDVRLMAMSDQELKDIIARSGEPMSGNLVHAVMVARAKDQLAREAAGARPARGVDPNAGVTEQPLAKPGEATPPSAAAAVKQQEDQAEAGADAAGKVTDQFGEEQPDRKKK